MTLSRERDMLKRKMLGLERELEGLKGCGGVSKKTSRAGRSFMQDSRQSSVSLFKDLNLSKGLEVQDDKENKQVNSSGFGGVSFSIE
jgi:hypothetical protein